MMNIKYLPLLLFMFLAPLAWAEGSEEQIKQILSADKAPVGIVFEVVSMDEDTLEWAVPVVNDYASRLRKRFPGIKLALVTHGMEQFALTRIHAEEYKGVQQGVVSLIKDKNVNVHVCGTFAVWNGVKDADFISEVDVPQAGPAQIGLYEEEGYDLIFLEPPEHN